MGSSPITGDDPVQKKQGKVTVKYDRKELRKRLVLEEWIIEQLSELYDCEVSLNSKVSGAHRSSIYFRSNSADFETVFPSPRGH